MLVLASFGVVCLLQLMLMDHLLFIPHHHGLSRVPLYLLRMAGDPALAPEREMVSLHMRMLGGVLRGMTHPNSGSY